MKKNVLFWVGVKSKDPHLRNKHGDFKYLDISKKCWELWCEKNDIVFFEYNTPSEPDTSAHKVTWQRWFDVFPLIEKANINYNKIAVIDGSTLIRQDTPNFFEITEDKFTCVLDESNVGWVHQSIGIYQKFFPNVNFNWTTYFNSGFLIYNKKHQDLVETIKKFWTDNDK